MAVTFTCIPKLGKEGGGVVWDKTAGKAIARFDQKGEFTTDDKKLIDKLNGMGYKVIKDDTPPAPKKKSKSDINEE